MTDNALTEKENLQLEQWLLQIDTDTLSDAEYAAMDQWLSVSDLRREHFAQLSVLWFGSAPTRADHCPDTIVPKVAPSALAKGRPWLAVAASIVIAFGALIALRQMPGADLVVPMGSPVQQTLADGTIMTAQPGTKVDIEFDDTLRHIALSAGAIYLQAAENAQRPMQVTTAHGAVVVVGTAFGVELQSDATFVGVTSGIVEVQSDGFDSRALTAGQSARFDRQSISQDGFSQPSYTWVDGLLTLDDVPLNSALALMNRYSSRRVVVLGSLPKANVSAVIAIENIDEAIAKLAAQHQLSVYQPPGLIVVL